MTKGDILMLAAMLAVFVACVAAEHWLDRREMQRQIERDRWHAWSMERRGL